MLFLGLLMHSNQVMNVAPYVFILSCWCSLLTSFGFWFLWLLREEDWMFQELILGVLDRLVFLALLLVLMKRLGWLFR